MEDKDEDELITVSAYLLRTPFNKDSNCVVMTADIAEKFKFQVGNHFSAASIGNDEEIEEIEYEVVKIYGNGDVMACKALNRL